MERLSLGIGSVSTLSQLQEMLTPECRKQPLQLSPKQFARVVRDAKVYTKVAVAKIDGFLRTIDLLETKADVPLPDVDAPNVISFDEPMVQRVIGERNPAVYCLRTVTGHGMQSCVQMLHGEVDAYCSSVTRGFRTGSFAISGSAIAAAYLSIQNVQTKEVFVQAIPLSETDLPLLRSLVKFCGKKTVAKTLIRYEEDHHRPNPFNVCAIKTVIPLEIQPACACCGVKDQELHVCSRCRSVKYCGRDCQKQHWPTHKLLCGKDRSVATVR